VVIGEQWAEVVKFALFVLGGVAVVWIMYRRD
jgi:hypothetical protein